MKKILIIISLVLLFSCDGTETKTTYIVKDSTVIHYDTLTIEQVKILYKDSITLISGIIVQNGAGQTIIKGQYKDAQFYHDLGKMKVIVNGDTLTRIWDNDTVVIRLGKWK